MQSDLEGPVNIGNPEYVTVTELAETIADVAGKKIRYRYVDGPVGVRSRNFANDRIYRTGWRGRNQTAGGAVEGSAVVCLEG